MYAMNRMLYILISLLFACIYNGHVNTEYYVGGCHCLCIISYIVKLSVFVFLNITNELQTLQNKFTILITR